MPPNVKLNLSEALLAHNPAPTTNPTPAAPAAEPKPSSRQRGGYHGIHGVYHGQKQENRDSGNLSFQVRQAIVDYSHLRTQQYEPEKVNIRTENRYNSREQKQIVAEKAKRSEDVAHRGFASDAKECYKPLGEPVVDSDALIYKTLRLDPTTFQRVVKDKHSDGNTKTIDVKAVNDRHRQRRGTKHESGTTILKQKLAQSKKRIHSVKFGVCFSQAVDDQKEKVIEPPKRTVPDDEVDWMNLKIDTEKQNLFQNMLERHKQAWNEKDPSATKNDAKKEAKEAKSQSSSHRHEHTMKEIEDILHIVPNPSFPETVERFFVTREKFYEQQQQLNQILEEDLSRLDLDRKNHFLKKYRAFEIRKGGMFNDDIRAMRNRADRERADAKNAILEKHSWYHDLINKVNATNKHLSKLEQVLLERIKCYIEDEVEFSQSVFVQMMKLIPQRVFNEDAIQRIIRFVKQHSKISERDFLEAIELANHEMKMSATALRSI